jgi:antirestriction protein ArdC
MTFNQIKKLNGQVKKGAKSEQVYFWYFVKKKTINEKTGKEEVKEQ